MLSLLFRYVCIYNRFAVAYGVNKLSLEVSISKYAFEALEVLEMIQQKESERVAVRLV